MASSPNSQKQAVITFLEKKGKDKRLIKKTGPRVVQSPLKLTQG